jgi:small multidrug resistance pump
MRDVPVGRHLEKSHMMPFPNFQAYLLLALSGTCSAVASLLLKIAGSPAAALPLLIGPLGVRACAVGFYGMGFVMYAWSLKTLPLTTAYPVMVAVTITEVFLFGMLGGERIWYGNLLGAALIAAGVALIIR